MKKHTWSLFFIFAASACGSILTGQTTLHNWQFNESVGTALNATVNSGADAGTYGTFIQSITGVETNGSALAINNAAGNHNSWLTTTDLNYDSGIYQVDMYITSWNFTGITGGSVGGAGAGLYVGFMQGNTSSTFVGADFNMTSDGSNVFLQSRLDASQVAGSHTLALTGNDLVLRLVVDAQAKTSSLLFDLGNTGTFTTVVAPTAYTRTLDDFRIRQSADMSGAAGVTIDYLTITQVPEPSTYALILGAWVIGFATYNRRLKR